MLSAGELSSGRIDLTNTKYVSREDHESFCKRIRPRPGDILYTKGGTTGVAVVNDLSMDFSVWVHVAVLRTDLELVAPEYLALALNSPFCYEQAQEYTHGTGNRDLGLTRMVLILLPLPPLEVQHEIVRTVGGLQAILEELTRVEAVTATVRDQARVSSLEALLADGEWVRMRDNWESLFTTPESVDDLRRTILDLAVRGRLVEQRAGEESAAELLVRAAQALKTYSGRKPRRCRIPDPPPTFEVPETWRWVELQDLGIVGPRNEVADETEAGFVPMAAIDDGFVPGHTAELRLWKEIKKGYTHLADGDIALAKITPCFQNRKSVVVSGLPNGIGAGTTELHVLRPFQGVLEPSYALVFLKSATFIEAGVPRMTGTAGQQRVPRDYFGACPIPLPPLDEQRRIVGRVTELMALCDELEERFRDLQDISERLADSIVHHVATR